MQSSELKSLLDQYIAGTLSEEDFKRLWETLKEKENEGIWLDAIEAAIVSNSQPVISNQSKAAEALENIKAKIYEQETRRRSLRARVVHLYENNKSAFRYAAAILVIISTSLFLQRSSETKKVQTETVVVSPSSDDVKPGGDKAVLTLADGTRIVLDNAGHGTIAKQGGMQVIKLANGQIQYKSLSSEAATAHHVSYNTMSTPRGGQYQLILPDGSRVWLNAESSITYPTAFSLKERKVNITGEVYFEVAKDKKKPFRVVAGDTEVEVLGTHFNVKAYPDDGPIKTSLLEGSVKINADVLKPGEAYVSGRIIPTNTEQDVAWKNGVFNFNNQRLSQVMLQLARWYDLEVVYPDSVPRKEYGGEIGRNLSLRQVLKGLEESGLRFEVVGKKVIVTTANTE